MSWLQLAPVFNYLMDYVQKRKRICIQTFNNVNLSAIAHSHMWIRFFEEKKNKDEVKARKIYNKMRITVEFVSLEWTVNLLASPALVRYTQIRRLWKLILLLHNLFENFSLSYFLLKAFNSILISIISLLMCLWLHPCNISPMQLSLDFSAIDPSTKWPTFLLFAGYLHTRPVDFTFDKKKQKTENRFLCCFQDCPSVVKWRIFSKNPTLAIAVLLNAVSSFEAGL